MTGQLPEPPWREQPAAVSAVAARARARSRMRIVTLAAGAASLVTAGVVAYHLPGPKHTAAVSPASPAGTPASSPATTYAGDDGGGDDGSHAVSAAQPAPAGKTATHATSGGS